MNSTEQWFTGVKYGISLLRSKNVESGYWCDLSQNIGQQKAAKVMILFGWLYSLDMCGNK